MTGKNPLLDIATELEKTALEDDYFISRKLYPNVDFYSGLIYQAMGLPTPFFPVLFAIPRTVGSAHADPYSAAAAAACALYGPRHGGANEAVIRMLTDIGTIDNVPSFVEAVKSGHGRLQGFGHRVYKNYDPRAKIIKRAADEVFAVTGKNPLLDIALKLEDVALSDDYFVSRKLYPNVDFYSGIIMRAMGIPVNMFTVMFAIGRLPGWIAHWKEVHDNKKSRIYRPRQVYIGPGQRDYVPIEKR